ncbi:hypothetical protein [Gallibacterium anatis]|uniref:hypothetical protein n=1 Tax=Gallibacterium anatis TaxID=750 RepID=UPI0039B392E7
MTDPKGNDADNDGVSNKDEKDNGTNPNSPDTDGDGKVDGKDDNNAYDKDSDGINDADEKETGTNPENKDPENTDSDGDGISDKDESDTTQPGMTDKDGDDVSDLIQPPKPGVKNVTKAVSKEDGGDGVERYTGGVEVDPYANGAKHIDKVQIDYTPEKADGTADSSVTIYAVNNGTNGQDQWVLQDAGKQPLTGKAAELVTIDPKTGKVTFAPDAVADNTEVTAQNINAKAKNPSAPVTVTTKPDNYDADKQLDDVDTDDDNDGVSDADETKGGTDPHNPTSNGGKDESGQPINDGDADSDGDGIPNREESKPGNKDITDENKDGVPDFIQPADPSVTKTQTNGKEDGGIKVDPKGGKDVHIDKTVIEYTPEDGNDGKGQPTTLTLENTGKNGNDHWVAKDGSGKELTPEELAEKGITVDPETGVTTFSPDAVADDTEISAQNTNKEEGSQPSKKVTEITPADDHDGDGTPDSEDTDDDNDGVKDVDEKAAGTDPHNPTTDGKTPDGNKDSDGDGIPNKDDTDVIKPPKPGVENATKQGADGQTRPTGGVEIDPYANFGTGVTNKHIDKVKIEYTPENGKDEAGTPTTIYAVNKGTNGQDQWELQDDKGQPLTAETAKLVTINSQTGKVTFAPDAVADKTEVTATNINTVTVDGKDDERPSEPTKVTSNVDDLDADGTPDSKDSDIDGDGVNNEDEKAAGLDPRSPDTNGDGTLDGQEDTDGDGKTNADESDPKGTGITDKDGDGIADLNDKPSSVEIAAVADDNIINAKEAAGDTIPVKVAVTFGDGDKDNFASITVKVGDNESVTIAKDQLGTPATDNGKDVYTVNVPKAAFGEFKDGTVKVDLNLKNPKTKEVSSAASDDQAFTVDTTAPIVNAKLDEGKPDDKSDDKVVVTFPTDPDTKEVTVEYTPKDGSGPVTVTYTKDPDGTWKPSDPNAPKVVEGEEGKGDKVELPVNTTLLPGSDVLVNAKDKAGNEAQPEIVKVPQAFGASVEGVNPQAGDNAINAKEADGGIKVTITPDPDKPFTSGDKATVTVTPKDGTDPKTYNATLGSDGNFSVNIPKEDIEALNGKEVKFEPKVEGKDPIAPIDNVKVDLTAPESPKVEKMDGDKVEITPPTDGDVNSIDVVVTKPDGSQETATLTKDPEGNNWKSDNPNVPVTDTDGDGNPEITLQPGETAQVGVTDKAGNSSDPVTAFNPQSKVVSVSVDDDGVLNNVEINGEKDAQGQVTTKPKDVPVTVAVQVPTTEVVDTVNVKVGDKTYTYSSDPAKAQDNTLTPAGTDKDGNQLYTANVPAGELKTAAGSETTGKVTAEVSVKPSVGGKVDPQTLPSKEGSYTIDETAPDAPTVTPAEDKVTVDIPDTGANGDADTVTVTFTPFEPKAEDAPKGDDQPVTVTFEKQPDGTWKPVGKENADKADWVKDGGEGKGQVIEIPSDKLKPGSEVSATATDPAGNTSAAGKGTVPARFDFMVDAISENDHLVDAKDAADGVAVTVTLPDNVAAGDKVVLTYTDPNGNVYKFDPPLAEDDNSTSTPTKDDKVSTTVDVPKDKDGNVIKAPITIVIPKEAFDAATSKDPSTPDASIKVELQDKDGHVKTDVKQPEPQSFAVDSVAPSQPTISVTDSGFDVTLPKDAQPGDQTTVTVTKDGTPTTYTYEKGEDGTWKPTGDNAATAPTAEGDKVSVPAGKGATIKAEATDDAGNSSGEVTAAKPETTVDGVKVGGDGYINADEAKGNVPVEVTVNKAEGEEPTVTVKVGDKSYPATETGKTDDGKAVYTAQVPADELKAAAKADNDNDDNKGQVTADVSVTKDGVTAPVAGNKQADYTIDTTAPSEPSVDKGTTSEGKPTLDVTLPTKDVNTGDTVTITVKDKDGKETPITVTKTDEGWKSSDETNYPVKEGKVSIPAEQGTTVKAQAQDPAGNKSDVADGFVPKSSISEVQIKGTGTDEALNNDKFLNADEWKTGETVDLVVTVKVDPSENIDPANLTVNGKNSTDGGFKVETPVYSADGSTATIKVTGVKYEDIKDLVKSSGADGQGELDVPVAIPVTKDGFSEAGNTGVTISGTGDSVVDTIAPKFDDNNINVNGSNVEVTLPTETDAKTTTIEVTGKDNSKQTITATYDETSKTWTLADGAPTGAKVDGGKVIIPTTDLQSGSSVTATATDVAGNTSKPAEKPLAVVPESERKLDLQIEGTNYGLGSSAATDKLVTGKDLADDKLTVKVMLPKVKEGDVIYFHVSVPKRDEEGNVIEGKKDYITLDNPDLAEWKSGTTPVKDDGGKYPYFKFSKEAADAANSRGYIEIQVPKSVNGKDFLTGNGTEKIKELDGFEAKVSYFTGEKATNYTDSGSKGSTTATNEKSYQFAVDTTAPDVDAKLENGNFIVDLANAKNAGQNDTVTVKVKDAQGQEKSYTYTRGADQNTWTSSDSGAPNANAGKLSIEAKAGDVLTVETKDVNGNVGTPESVFKAGTTVQSITVAGDDVVNKNEASDDAVPVEVALKVADGETVTSVKVKVNNQEYPTVPTGNKDASGNEIFVAKVPGSALRDNAVKTGGESQEKPDVTVSEVIVSKSGDGFENAKGYGEPKTEDYDVNVNQIVPDVAAQKDGSVTVAMPTEKDAKEVQVKWTDEQGKEHTVTYTKGEKDGKEIWTSSEPNTLPSLDSHNVNDQGVFSVTLPKNDVKDGSHVTATVTKTTTGNNGGSDDAIANNDTPPSSLAVEINDGGDGKLSYDDLAADGTTGAKVYFDPAEFLANSSKTEGKFNVAVTSETGGRTEVKNYSVEFKQKGDSVLEGYNVTAKDKEGKPVEVKFDDASGRYYFDVEGLKAPAAPTSEQEIEPKINVTADFSTEDKAIQGQATDQSTRLKGMQITSIQVEDNRDQLYDYQVALVKSQISKEDLEKGTYTIDSLFRKQFSGTRDVTTNAVKFDDDTWEHISVHVEKGAPDATDYIGKNLKVSIVDATTGKQVEDLGTQTIADGQTAYNFASKISLDDGKYKIKAEVVDENGKTIDDSSSKTSGEITVDTDLRVHSTTTENSPFSNVYDIGEKGYGARHERLTTAAELNASESQEDDFTGGSQALQIANLLSYIAANKEATNPIKIVKVDGERHVLMDEAGNILSSFDNVSIAYRVTGNINMSTAPTSEDLMYKIGRWEQVDRSVSNGAKTSNGDDYLLVTAKNSANKDGSFNYGNGGYNWDDAASWWDSSWTKDGLSGMINGPTPYDSNDKLNGKVLEIDMAGGNDTIDAMMVMGKTAIYTDSKNALEGALSGDDTIHLARGIWSYGSPISVQAHNMGMAGDGDQAIYMGGGNDTFTISGVVLTYVPDSNGKPWTRPGGIYWGGNSPYSFKDSDKASLLFSSVRLDMGSGDDKVSIKGDIIADADMSVNHSNYFTLGAGNDTFTSGSLRDTYSKGRSSNVLDLGEGHDTVHIKGNIEGSTLIISKDSSDITVDGGVILRQSGEGDASMLLGKGKDVVNITGNVISKAGSTMDRYYDVISDNNPNGGNAKVVDGAWYKESQYVIGNQLKQNALTMFDLGHGDNQLTVGGNWENTSIYAGDGNDILEIKGDVDRVYTGGVNNTHGIYLGNGNNIAELRGNVNRADIVTGNGNDILRIGKDFYNSTNAFNYVKLGDGNNEFEIGGIAHHVNFTSGTGNDRYSFEGKEAHDLWIRTGAGDDDVFFGKRGTVQTGKDGKPNYAAEHDESGTKVGVDYTDKLSLVSVNLGDGNDVFHSGDIGGSTIKAGEDQTKSATATGNKDINIHGRAESVDIFTGTGSDKVTIDKDFYNSGARGIINLSGGDDVLTIGNNGLHPAQEYGLSAEAKEALGVISVYNADINLGAGNDTVVLKGGIGHDVKDNMGSSTRDVIDLGDGSDNLAILGTVFNTKIEAGNGNDNIYINTLDFYRLNGEMTTLSFRGGNNNVVIDKLTYTGGNNGTAGDFHKAFNIDVRFDGTEGGGFLRTNLKPNETFNGKVKWEKSTEAKSLDEWAKDENNHLDPNAAAFKDHAAGDKYYQYTYKDVNTGNSLHIYIEDNAYPTNII